jgi:hypothetical protein
VVAWAARVAQAAVALGVVAEYSDDSAMCIGTQWGRTALCTLPESE